MMKNLKKLQLADKYKNLSLLLLCLLHISIGQAQNQHWSCNIYDYQYDMTAYVSLVVDGTMVEDYSYYEIAAFCGEECRGVATIQTSEKDELSATYGYLRIRSNQQGDETITFKVYDGRALKETVVSSLALTFKSQDVVGMPSSPLLLNIDNIVVGDVNGDGTINLTDIATIANVISGKENNDGVRSRADVNGDEIIDVADIITVINLITGDS